MKFNAGKKMYSGDSIRVVHPLFQEEDDGSIPISPLQFHIGRISVPQAIQLNQLWHSRLPVLHRSNVDRSTHTACFAAEYKNTFYAVAVYTTPIAGKGLTKGEQWIELRRLAVSDDAPRNTCSRMISRTLKMLKYLYPELVRAVSYHDTDVHAGTIYKAANWTPAGEVTSTNWGMRRSEHGRKRNPVIAPGKKIRWEYAL